MPLTVQAPPLSLYIHIPWCVRKCPYCDFNSHAVDGVLPERLYIDALLADLEQETHELVAGRPLHSLFIGGGTPSLFSVEGIEALLTGVSRRIASSGNMEITLEANPATVEAAKFAELRAIGVNRLSIGVQSFDDVSLVALGRAHDGREAIRAVEAAHTAGFHSFNLDLMFGLPGQTPESARRDVETATALEPVHISYYQLTLEPNTLFHRHPPLLPGDEEIWAIQRKSQEMLAQQGFLQYEISAYARQGFHSRHNLNYWKFGDYLGIGAGAHGKITEPQDQTVMRYWKLKHPRRYLACACGADRIGGRNLIPADELPLEFMMNVLRLKQGCEKRLFIERTGLPLSALEPAYSDCVAEGLLKEHPTHIVCTHSGWNFLDEILQRFIPARAV
ncbi:MAG: radical SAM family heme chaperone HemW [Pseudomonadota bacterium]